MYKKKRTGWCSVGTMVASKQNVQQARFSFRCYIDRQLSPFSSSSRSLSVGISAGDAASL